MHAAAHSQYSAACFWRLCLRSLLCLCLGLWLSGAAQAQGIESIIRPGQLMQPHAKYDDDCKQCHVKLDRKAQDRLCMDCHKDIGQDVRSHSGYHGRLEQTVCRTCHSDHKGRDFRAADFDHAKFDHRQTNYVLRGKHEKVECAKCHVVNKKFREAPQKCSACHAKDDVHKGSLGPKCADCHTENNWKEARFDHDTTRFPLTGKHADVHCDDCHKDKQYKNTPMDCYACHRKVDDQKGHKGLFGEKCETCHGTKAWKPSKFNHDTDTKYPLRGQHKTVVCKDCHTGNLYKDKLSEDCYACHKKDDKHKGSLGTQCESCHTEKTWKEALRFDHAKTDFPLLGKHVDVKCGDCHKSLAYKDAPKDCFSCHEKDDKHRGTLGKACADCHQEKDWKSTQQRFDHQRTRFPLKNAHAASSVQCVDCHKDLQSFRNTSLACVTCHRKDDKHQGQLSEKCDSCHNDKAWRGTSFDHANARFALTGAHLKVECKSCHESLRYRDAPSDCYACHKKDDKHKQAYGEPCASCHNTRSWAVWSFDHNVRSKYKLEGAHGKVACASCHTLPAPAGKPIASLSTTCVSCHRSDDAHGGKFGQRCEQCHVSESWKKMRGRFSQSPIAAWVALAQGGGR